MIRRTVARAFGPAAAASSASAAADGRPADPLPTAVRGARGRRMEKVFKELQAAIERGIQEWGEAAGGKNPLQLTPPRQAADGMEMFLSAPGGGYRILAETAGMIRIERAAGKRFRPASILLAHPDEDGVERLVEKPLDLPRAPFRFTSAAKVARALLLEGEEGILDAPRGRDEAPRARET